MAAPPSEGVPQQVMLLVQVNALVDAQRKFVLDARSLEVSTRRPLRRCLDR